MTTFQLEVPDDRGSGVVIRTLEDGIYVGNLVSHNHKNWPTHIAYVFNGEAMLHNLKSEQIGTHRFAGQNDYLFQYKKVTITHIVANEIK